MQPIASSSGKKFPKGAWTIVNILLYLILGCVIAFTPIYDCSEELGSGYGMAFLAYRGLEGDNGIAFLVFYSLFLALVRAGIVFQILSPVLARFKGGDAGDKSFVLAAIFFTSGNLIHCINSMTYTFPIPLILSLIGGLLGFGSIFLHIKKFAELSNV